MAGKNSMSSLSQGYVLCWCIRTKDCINVNTCSVAWTKQVADHTTEGYALHSGFLVIKLYSLPRILGT